MDYLDVNIMVDIFLEQSMIWILKYHRMYKKIMIVLILIELQMQVQPRYRIFNAHFVQNANTLDLKHDTYVDVWKTDY